MSASASASLKRAAALAAAVGIFSCGLFARPLLFGREVVRADEPGVEAAAPSLRRLLAIDSGDLGTEHPLVPELDLEDGPLRLFAQTAGQMKRELLVHYLRTPPEDRWSDEEYELLALSINSTVQLMAPHRRRSGRTFIAHGIGSGSCGLKAGLDAVSVAALIAHGTYIKSWGTVEKPEDDCKVREAVRQLFGAKTETALWKFTALFGHGPSNWAPSVWLAGLREGVYTEEEKNIIAMVICDDFEEAMDQDLLWSMNWKARPAHFHENMLEVAQLVGNGKLEEMARDVYRHTDALFGVGAAAHSFSPSIVADAEAGGPSAEIVSGVEMINRHCNPSGSPHGLGTGFSRPPWLKSLFVAQKVDPYQFLEEWDQWRSRVDEQCMDSLGASGAGGSGYSATFRHAT